MEKKINTSFEAATEAEVLGGIELDKAKMLLAQTLDLLDDYAKYDNIFYKVADGNYIRTFVDVAFDYVINVQKRMEKLSDYLYEESKREKQEKTEVRKIA